MLIDEAAYAASDVLSAFHSSGFCCQVAKADSLQPTRPAEITTGFGKFPRLTSRQSVVRESEVISKTSFSRMKRSSLITPYLFKIYSDCITAGTCIRTPFLSGIRQPEKSSTARFSLCWRRRHPMPSKHFCSSR